jgi:integrase
MARIRKRGDRHHVEIRRKGHPPIYGNFPTKAEAKEWAAERERELRHGTVTIAHKRTLRELLDAYSAIRSREWDKKRLLWMSQQPIAATQLRDLTPEVLEKWRDARLETVSAETVRRDLTLLSGALSRARDVWKWVADNPLRLVKRPEPGDSRERIATQEEIETICYVAGYELGTAPETKTARVAAAFCFAVETGLMPVEISRLNRSWIVGSACICPKVKTRPKRQVPLSSRAKQILKDVDYDFRLDPSAIDALWREKIRPRAACEGLNFYDSRATAFTRLAKKFEVLELAKISGHRDINRLLAYYRESGEELAKRLD